MLSTIVGYLNDRIKELNLFAVRNGVCEIITDGTKTFPAYWNNKKYNTVSDFKDSTLYHRLNGSIDIDQSEDESTTGCAINSRKSYSMRLVVFINKDKCSTGIEFDEQVLNSIEKKISFSGNKELENLLSASGVSVTVNKFIFDRNQLYREEYDSTNKIGFEYSYVAIDYTIEINIDLNCITEIC